MRTNLRISLSVVPEDHFSSDDEDEEDKQKDVRITRKHLHIVDH